MKIRLSDLIATGIYFFIVLSTVFNMRYQLNQQQLWNRLFLLSLVAVIGLDILFILLRLRNNRGKLDFEIVAALLLLAYEMAVSYINDLFPVAEIVRDVIPWPLTFAVLYTHIKKNGIPDSFRLLTFIGISLCCILSIPNIARHLVDYGRSGGVIFPVYYCIVYLGIYLRLFSGKSKYFFMIAVTALLFVSTKRLGVLIVLIGLVAWFYCDAHVKGDLRAKGRAYTTYTVALGAALAAMYYFASRLNISTFDRIRNLAVDEGSGRGFIWRVVLGSFADSPVIQKVFGHGYHAVSYRVYIWSRARSMAHNSFMETMYDYGVVGLLFIIILVAVIIKRTIVAGKRKSASFPVLAYSVVGLLLLGFFSYFFEQSVLIMLFIVLWSICFGDEQHKEMMQIKRNEA